MLIGRLLFVFAMAAATCAFAGELAEGERESLRMDLEKEDTFVVQGMQDWRVVVGRVLPLRFGEVVVNPRAGDSFSLAMNFLCDTPDLAKYDTPEKMKRAVKAASRQYLSGSVEKAVNLEELSVGGRFGCFATFTDASLVGKKEYPVGEYAYITVGVLRLTDNSALTFSLMSKSKDGDDFNKPMDYLKSFVVPVPVTTKPAPQN